MRKYIKLFLLLTFLSIAIGSVSVDGAIGYTYSHKGRPIHSTVGLSTSADGIFTVVSNRWKNPVTGESLSAAEFTSPEDLFIYTETDKDGNKSDVIYIVDSVSNELFVFDVRVYCTRS